MITPNTTRPAPILIEQDPAKPLVLDMATSAIAWYAVKEAKEAGQPIPGDVAYDRDGRPTTDPAAALAGALRVFDRSYKGSHLALMVEILGGALGGGDVEDKWAKANWGNLVLAIDPELLGPRDAFVAKVQAIVARVTGAKRFPAGSGGGHAEGAPCLPGERSEARAEEVARTGMIELEKSLHEGLLAEFRRTGGELEEEEEGEE